MNIVLNATLLLARLSTLRQLMVDNQPLLDAYIVPLNDAHQGTRVPECSARLQYISGFTGSSGTVLITGNAALLWTDGRYFTQAAEELDENWTLMREGLPDTPTMDAYLKSELGPKAVVGVDPSLYSKTSWENLRGKLELSDQELLGVDNNLVDETWLQDVDNPRPACPNEPVIQIPLHYSGKSTKEKLAEVRKLMLEAKADGLVLNQLDDIAWLLNLRGFDIPSAALFLSFAIVKQNGFELLITPTKISAEIRNSLSQDGGAIFDYTEVNDRVTNLVSSTQGSIWLDKTCSYSLVSRVPSARQIIDLSPVVPMKSVKNPTEINGVKNALIRDAAILARLYAWVEDAVARGEVVTELSASEKLMQMRRELGEIFLTTSFTTIAGVDSNGAVIHYRPAPTTNKQVTVQSMFLIDAGATYRDGTTDITRTFHYGTPSDYQKECYTRVLKGQIAVARSKFPLYTRGNRLDSFARKFLWDFGLDYLHGTGHGIGINVHEGPSRISYDYNLAPDDRGLRENMLTSNEPGYYEEGSFGIRLENIVRVVNSTVKGPDNKQFLEIEDMTFLPYQHKLIKKDLLTVQEIEYLNDYQEKCRQIVGSYVNQHYSGDLAYNWIIKETQPF